MTQWHTQEQPDPLRDNEVHLWITPLTTAPEKLFYFKSKTALNFSVSHSEDQGLFGFARARRIGVDLEYVRPDVDALALAKRYFSPDEFRRLRRLPATERYQAFYCALGRAHPDAMIELGNECNLNGF
jgi:hypothetical protein